MTAKLTMAKPYLLQMTETREGQKFSEPSITEQKGWLSPGNQLRRLTEAGERLETYKLENYDEFYYGDEEPSLDPIRTAEDIQDEMLIIQNKMDRFKQANSKLETALKEREKLETERREKAEQERIEKMIKKVNNENQEEKKTEN